MARIRMRIIDKLLKYKKKLIIKPKKISHKNVLVSYVLFPDFFNINNKYFIQSHNNKIICKLFTNVLNELGYNVYLYSYDNENIDYSKNYDIFIGHNKTFYKIAKKINSGCKKILITTGCNPEYDNNILEIRSKELCKRKNISSNENFFSPIIIQDFPKKNFHSSDYIYMLGANSFVAKTWYEEYSKKFYNYFNITQYHLKNKKILNNKTFIFMSNEGQIRRGLDLVLDAFSDLSDLKLYVCGPYRKEVSFYNLYHDYFIKYKNIKDLGFIDKSKKLFNEIVEESEFVVLPSCSDAQSGSVLNLMALGLIPIITQEVGFTDVEEYGYLIPDFSVKSLKETLLRAVNASEEEKSIKKIKLLKKMQDHTPEKIKENFTNFILNTVLSDVKHEY